MTEQECLSCKFYQAEFTEYGLDEWCIKDNIYLHSKDNCPNFIKEDLE